MREPLPYKELNLKPLRARVLFFDPAPVYARITVDPYKRVQSISMSHTFPSVPCECACGCGEKLTGKKTRWHSQVCMDFAYHVTSIICGRFDVVKSYLNRYYEWRCMDCGCEDQLRETKNGWISDIQIDHIIGVKHGGGGCWLSNYRLRCHACHVKKTNTDFNRKQK